VDDFRPHLWQASAFVAPLRIGQGTQNKVLEAMAASLPVVASSEAARGIMRPRGPHIRVADSDDDFAHHVLELLDDEQAARVQTHAALQMVRELHSWDAAVARLTTLLQDARR
jgi:glycosyltransferase involved in cell wall biosynthesis